MGENAVIERHGNVSVHGGGVGSRHGGAVRLSGSEGGVKVSCGGGEFQVNVPVDGSGVNRAEDGRFADGTFRKAQVDIPVQVPGSMAAYPSVVGDHSLSKRYP